MSAYVYVGSELELFASAVNWKSYFCSHLAPHIGSNVLEVGAGIGETTRVLCQGGPRRWLCLEPDGQMAEQLQARLDRGELPACCEVKCGTCRDLSAEGAFDTALYIDVLEHIEDHQRELADAAQLLEPGGRLIVLSPAFQFLYSPFDKAVGHFRRYNRRSLLRVAPAGTSLLEAFYLDSVGLFASLGNRLLLRRANPKASQIEVWDRYMVRASRWIDPLVGYAMGRSVIAVWKKDSPGGTRQVQNGSR